MGLTPRPLKVGPEYKSRKWPAVYVEFRPPVGSSQPRKLTHHLYTSPGGQTPLYKSRQVRFVELRPESLANSPGS